MRWSAGAIPAPAGAAGAPWRLSLDIAPVLEAGESDDVIGDVFVAAANAGLFVHTLEGRRVLRAHVQWPSLASSRARETMTTRVRLSPSRRQPSSSSGQAAGSLFRAGYVDLDAATATTSARPVLDYGDL